MLRHHRLYGVSLRKKHLDGRTVALARGVHHVVGFLRQPSGVEGDDARLRIDAHQHVDEHHVFGAEARGQRDAPPEAIVGQAHDVLGGQLLGLQRQRGNRLL